MNDALSVTGAIVAVPTWTNGGFATWRAFGQPNSRSPLKSVATTVSSLTLSRLSSASAATSMPSMYPTLPASQPPVLIKVPLGSGDIPPNASTLTPDSAPSDRGIQPTVTPVGVTATDKSTSSVPTCSVVHVTDAHT